MGMRKRNSRESYRLAVCQFEPVFLNKEVNLEKMEDMAQRASLSGAELLIFPECCVTGYAVGELAHEITGLAETVLGPQSGPSVSRMESLANKLGVHIIFGLPELGAGVIHNSVVYIVPGLGVVGSCHKIHMWKDEQEIFTRGKEFTVWEGPVGRLGSLICYDLEFPEAVRILALRGANVVAVPTANMRPWVELQRVYARARAMENSVFVAVSNCLGKVGSTEFFGGSIIVNPYGHILAEAGEAEAILVADVDLRLINKATEDCNYLEKRRPELYDQLCLSQQIKASIN
jgi:predicted amidohydrolase